jgi:FixJ family two-component response regulator
MPHPAVMTQRAKKSSRVPETPPQVLVAIVDDDESLRESLPDLLSELGFSARVFASADEFLKAGAAATTRCLILDIAMPGMSGPELQQELTARGHTIATVFITARADEPLRRQLIARGAVDVLFKPFSGQALKAALDTALAESRGR